MFIFNISSPTDCTSICLDCRVRVLHFNVFMTHECPSRQIRPIEFSCASKIFHCLLVLSAKRVMIPCDSLINLRPRIRDEVGITHQPDSILQVDLCRAQGIHEQGEKALDGFQSHKECLNTRRYHRLGMGRPQGFFQTAFPLDQSLLAASHESIIR